MTTKEKIVAVLTEHTDGLSRSELERKTECNRGTFRRVLGQLVKSGEVAVTIEKREYGVGSATGGYFLTTAVHRLGDPQIEGQLDIEGGEAAA